MSDEAGIVRTLRRALLALTAAGIAGTTIELAMIRHWTSTDQLIPWFALAVLAIACASIVFRPTPSTIRAARVIAVVVAVAAVFGVYEHVHANYEAGPLDYRYADSWDGMSALSRWWTAASGGVGPSPVLAPLLMAQAAACLVLATLTARSGGDRTDGAAR